MFIIQWIKQRFIQKKRISLCSGSCFVCRILSNILDDLQVFSKVLLNKSALPFNSKHLSTFFFCLSVVICMVQNKQAIQRVLSTCPVKTAGYAKSLFWYQWLSSASQNLFHYYGGTDIFLRIMCPLDIILKEKKKKKLAFPHLFKPHISLYFIQIKMLYFWTVTYNGFLLHTN